VSGVSASRRSARISFWRFSMTFASSYASFDHP